MPFIRACHLVVYASFGWVGGWGREGREEVLLK